MSASNNSIEKYTVLPTQLEDADAVRAVGERAFGQVSFQAYIFPPSRAHLTPPAEKAKWRADRLRKMLKGGDILHFKCVPESDQSKVVGYAAWYRPGHFAKGKSLSQSWGFKRDEEGDVKKSAPESDLTAQAGPAGAKPPGPVDEAKGDGEGEDYPACMDVDVQRESMEIMDRERKKIWGDDANYWYLAGLAVDPDYQGQGHARKLVDMGLAWADADGVPTYLEATPNGALMYPKFGFKKVGEYPFFGGEHVCEFNIRQPGASKVTVAGAETPQ